MGLIFNISNGPDKKERTKCNEPVGMQKDDNFSILSTTLLIGLNINFLRNLCKAAANQFPYNKILSESK